MYQTSHSYSPRVMYMNSRGSSQLEHIANHNDTTSSNTYQSAVSSQQSYSFTPSILPQLFSPSAFSYQVESNLSYQQSQQNLYTIFNQKTEYHFQPDHFLKPGKEGLFSGTTEEIKEYIEDAFQLIFHQPFPHNIKISICNKDQFRKIAPHESTIGLSINRRKQNLLSEIFILNDCLARVMLTLGHELGHVLTETLDNPHDEEAKAYAFSLAWIKIIKQHNLASLRDAIITENPAQNGLHNIAFHFVERMICLGKSAYETYQELIQRVISINTII